MVAYAIYNQFDLDSTNLINNLKHISKKANMILYRDKENSQYSKCAKLFMEEAKKIGFEKILIHQDIDLACFVNADGVHLTSKQIEIIPKAKFFKLFTVVSTHSLSEVKEAERLGADMITFSPIYETPDKGKPKGIEALREIVSRVNIPVIALGGILTKEQIEECIKAGAKGFASIRYFLNKE
jgi:thiamine-phosphate pyrophosphorylase